MRNTIKCDIKHYSHIYRRFNETIPNKSIFYIIKILASEYVVYLTIDYK